MERFGRKPSRYKGITISPTGKRRPASRQLVGTVDQIVAMVRPELSRDDRHKAAAVIAADVRPDAKTLRSTEIVRTRTAVARALRGTGQRLSNEHRLTR